MVPYDAQLASPAMDDYSLAAREYDRRLILFCHVLYRI